MKRCDLHKSNYSWAEACPKCVVMHAGFRDFYARGTTEFRANYAKSLVVFLTDKLIKGISLSWGETAILEDAWNKL